jgi:hypothetical protein
MAKALRLSWVLKRKLQRAGCGPLTPRRRTRIQQKMAECEFALRPKSKGIVLCRRLGVLRLGYRLRLFLTFCGKFLCHGLLQFLAIYAVAFGLVHENVGAAWRWIADKPNQAG